MIFAQMTNIIEGFSSIINLINYPYMIFVTLFALFLLKYREVYLPNIKSEIILRQMKLMITTIVGLISAAIFYYLTFYTDVSIIIHYTSEADYVLSCLFSFFLTTYAYDLIVKKIMKKLKLK